jgi:hypothetical protein
LRWKIGYSTGSEASNLVWQWENPNERNAPLDTKNPLLESRHHTTSGGIKKILALNP